MPQDGPHPASPCTNDCTFDPESELCSGCFRTLDEIEAWWTMTAEEKLGVLAAAGRRREERESE
jgi:uncharacterized protein